MGVSVGAKTKITQAEESVLFDRAALTLRLYVVVKSPEENADFISCLKARPTKFKSFSEASLASEANFGRGFDVP